MRLLPVAPRPFEDELLTSWQCRVTCRYSSTPPQIEVWLGGPPTPMRESFKARDFQPDKDMTWRWAHASRLKEHDLQRLALCDLERPEECYVTNPLDRGVCPVCLDEDAEKGSDHYCRRNWAHVEAAVCEEHGVALQSACQCCFRSGLFQFRSMPDGVRLVCPSCTSVISERRGRQPRQDRLLESMSAITEAIDGKGFQLDTVIAASDFLWAPQPHGLPYITRLGISLPYGRAPRPPASLSALPLAWRAASIEAVAELAGLIDRREIGNVPTFAHKAFRNSRGGEEEPAPKNIVATAHERAELQLRTDDDYRRLALDLLKSQAWKDMPSNTGRKKDCAIGRLMSRALSGG
ncbi:TniQ family protein [Rhizobium leguminosarum]|uniref:TniQ family protein n=1 Tax=Rhizobium leguminosarum TaxID=384 RepID=UPI0014422DE1|nr:TniQ family protein [Rhizobium leguminosarum]